MYTCILSVFNWQPVPGTSHVLQPWYSRTRWRICAVPNKAVFPIIINLLFLLLLLLLSLLIYNIS